MYSTAIFIIVVLQTSLAFSGNQNYPSQTIRNRKSFNAGLSLRSNSGLVAVSSSSSHAMLSQSETDNPNDPYLRKRMRQITGFSLTAFRATMRAATGISLTALYASALAATSAFVRRIMALVLAPLPAWFRYFLQPFLILYYAPLFILRNLTGPTGKRARETHKCFVSGFREAVEVAEHKAEGYWPVHIDGKLQMLSLGSMRGLVFPL